MKILSTFFLLISFISLNCNATAQIPDAIAIKDIQYRLNTNPLDKYLAEIRWERPEYASISSANWRGYLASWKIDAGNMLLIDVTIEIYNEAEERHETKSILYELFPDSNSIKARWYSGALIIPHGEMTNYVHMGYGSSYESYIVIRIKDGVVVDYQDFAGSEFEKYKEKKFQAFKETLDFQKQLNELTTGEYDWSEEEALNFMQSFHAEYYLSL